MTIFEQAAGVTWGGPEGSQGCPPSGTGGSCTVGRPHRDWANSSPMGSPAAMDGLAAMGNQAATSIHTVEGIWGVTGDACQLTSKSRPPQWWAALGTLQRGEVPPPALSDLGGGSPLRNVALERVPQPRCPMEVSQQEGTLIPHTLLTQTWSTIWEGTHSSREQKEGGTPGKACGPNLPWVTTASGLSGLVNI